MNPGNVEVVSCLGRGLHSLSALAGIIISKNTDADGHQCDDGE